MIKQQVLRAQTRTLVKELACRHAVKRGWPGHGDLVRRKTVESELYSAGAG